jgi:hypothetical protein
VVQQELPIVIYINDSVPDKYRSDVRAALETWNDALSVPVFKYGGVDLGPVRPRVESKNIVYWLDTWNTGANQQAVAAMVYRGNNILDADIKFNAQDFQFFIDGESGVDKVHFRSVVLHELGHVLGLGHIEGIDSIMNPTFADNTIRDQLFDIDKHDIRCQYK